MALDFAVSRGDQIDSLYQKALFNIFTGRTTKPRGMYTKEILSHRVVLEDVRNNVLVSPVRDLNPKFMVAEWLWIALGLEDVASIAQYNENIRHFSDDGLIFNGAYGPRIINQGDYILETLRRDRDSRQAVLTIWRENPRSSKDIPCTVSMQFLIRDERLNLLVNMRSSDGWLGLPYDMYNFSQLCSYVAAILEVEPGFLSMDLGSSHLYEKDWERAQEMIGSVSETLRSPRLTKTSWSQTMSKIREVLKRPKETSFVDLLDPWHHYCRVLSSRTRQVAWEVIREMSGGGEEMDTVKDDQGTTTPQVEEQPEEKQADSDVDEEQPDEEKEEE